MSEIADRLRERRRKQLEHLINEVVARLFLFGLFIQGSLFADKVSNINKVHINLVDIFLQEVGISLSSDVQGRNGKGSIEFTVFDEKRSPFSEIFTFLKFLWRDYVLTTIVDIFVK